MDTPPRRPPPERLAGDRFVLRCFEPGDGPALAEAIAASTDHLRPWMAWALPVPSPAESEQVVRRFRADWLADRDFTLGIWTPTGDRVLGGTGFHLRGRPVGDAVAEIGMWIRADEAGRGLGSQVLRRLLRWGLTAWPWERLAWRAQHRVGADGRARGHAAGGPPPR